MSLTLFTNFSVVTGHIWSAGTKFDEAPPGFWDTPGRRMGPDAFVLDVSLYRKSSRFPTATGGRGSGGGERQFVRRA